MHVAVKEEFLPFHPSPVGLSFFWLGCESPLQTKVPGKLMVSGSGSKPQEIVVVSGLIKKVEEKSTKRDVHRQNSFCLKEKIIRIGSGAFRRKTTSDAGVLQPSLCSFLFLT